MKKLLKFRIEEFGRLPTALLTLALFAGFASVGQAQDMPELVVTAAKTELCDTAATLRDDMQAKAQLAVWQTRVSVASDLGLRLTADDRPLSLAGRDAGKRG